MTGLVAVETGKLREWGEHGIKPVKSWESGQMCAELLGWNQSSDLVCWVWTMVPVATK